MRSILPSFLKYLLAVYLLVMLIMSLGRLYLTLQYGVLLPEDTFGWAFKSFYQGWQFDSTIAAYVIALPFLVLSFTYLFNQSLTRLLRFFKYYFNVLFLAVIVLVVADLPYFAFYNSRLSKGILSWTDEPWLMVEAVIGENDYYPFILMGIILIIGVFILNGKILKALMVQSNTGDPIWKRILLFLITGFIVFLGVRGDWDFANKPITAERAFISNNAFVNQMSMNPVFNFFDSFRSMDIEVFDDEEALKLTAESLGIKEKLDCSPLARIEKDSVKSRPLNVVLILVESLSANRVSCLDWDKELTPVIDSLSKQALFFKNFYSSGIHTHNGIYSSLYGLPAILHNKPMSDSYVSQIEHNGLPQSLKKRDYVNSYFCSGDLNFDNMGSFLNEHGFDDVNGENRYKKEDIYNAWGAADHTIFDYALTDMIATTGEGNNFFTTILTVSSHDGYYPPIVEDFQPKSDVRDDHRFEYADWAIGRFLKKSSEYDWFDSTIFVILGDHGQNFNPIYQLPLSYVHVPLLIYSPAFKGGKRIEDLAMQIDVFPTIMGLLKGEYMNNTLGLDLFKEKRSMVYFSSDDEIGCLDNDHYLLIRNNGLESMYHYDEKSVEDVLSKNSAKGLKMKERALADFQSTQCLMSRDLLGACN